MEGVGNTMSYKTALLINPYTGELQCKICGTIFYSEIKPIVGEVYYNTEFRCPNGCDINTNPTDECGEHS